MRRRFLALLTVVAMTMLVLTACGGNDAGVGDNVTGDEDTGRKDVVTIQVGYENNTSEPAALAVEEWARLVEEKSGGSLNLELFPNSALGKKTDLIDQMILGEPVITVADGAFLADYGVADFGIFYAPFMFDSWEEEFAVVESSWYQGLSDELADVAGIRILSSNWIYGARHMLTKQEVVTPSDLAGVKMRVSANELSILSFNELGLSPVGMDMGEVYQALQAGTIDGVENPITSLANRSFHEVAKNLVKDGHILAVSMWICGEDFFASLSPEHQEILVSAANEAGLYNNQLQEEAEAEAEQMMLDAGVNIVELSDEEMALWREMAMPFFEKGSTLGWSDGLYDTVKAAGK